MASNSDNTKNSDKLPRREYSDEDKSAALALLSLNNGNVNKTATSLSIPETTLRKWKEARTEKPDSLLANNAQKFEGSLKDRFEQEIHRAMDAAGIQLDGGGADLNTIIRYIEMMTDKYQVLNNRPSAITGTQSENKLHILAELLLSAPKNDPKQLNPQPAENLSTDQDSN